MTDVGQAPGARHHVHLATSSDRDTASQPATVTIAITAALAAARLEWQRSRRAGPRPLAELRDAADWAYACGPTFEPHGRCFDVDGTLTITLADVACDWSPLDIRGTPGGLMKINYESGPEPVLRAPGPGH